MDTISPATDTMPVPPPVEDAVNPKANDLSKDTKMATSSKMPNSKKVKPVKEATKMKKKPAHPPISEMVLDSIKSLKMHKGAPAEAILEHVMGKFKAGTKSMKPYVTRFLRSGVEKGILERVSGEGPSDGRFKIKKPESTKKDKQMVKPKTKAVKIRAKP